MTSREVFRVLRQVRYVEVSPDKLAVFDRVCPRHSVVLQVDERYQLRCPASGHLVEQWYVVERRTGRIVQAGCLHLDDLRREEALSDSEEDE